MATATEQVIARFEVPNGIKHAIAMVRKSSVVHRKPRDLYHQKINEGIETGAKLTQCKRAIMHDLADRLGKNEAERFASMFCVTGLVPDPTGSIGALDANVEMTPLVKHCLCMVQALAWKVYGLDPIFHNYPVNSESSVTFPYYKRGAEGVLIKRAYHESFLKHGRRIRDELEREDWKALHSSEYHLPMFFIGTTGLRIQPRGMKEVFWSGLDVVRCTIKPNKVTNWKGDEVNANMDVPGSDIDKTGKGRGVAGQSSSTNQLLSEIFSPQREAMYDKAMWCSSDWLASWKQIFQSCVALGWDPKKIATRSTDFSRMDGHMRRVFMEAILAGMQRAGWSKAALILKRKIEFSPMLCPCDSKSADVRESFAIMKGVEDDSHVTEIDGGHHSGTGTTDVDNGIYGGGIMSCIEIWAGNLVCKGYSRDLPADEHLVLLFKRWIDERWDTYFECIPTPGDKCVMAGNKGDDNVAVHPDQDAQARYDLALNDVAPYFDIGPEPRTTFLGNIFLPQGDGYAAEDRFFENNLCPERSVEGRPFALPLGVPARMERYKTNPMVTEHLLPVLETQTAKFYGESFTHLAQMAPMPETPPQPINAAEINFLYDPSVLVYKYKYEGDIRPELVLATGTYFFIPAEEIKTIYETFRR